MLNVDEGYILSIGGVMEGAIVVNRRAHPFGSSG
jgi:hypothetical protein